MATISFLGQTDLNVEYSKNPQEKLCILSHFFFVVLKYPSMYLFVICLPLLEYKLVRTCYNYIPSTENKAWQSYVLHEWVFYYPYKQDYWQYYFLGR